jgi:hypothetical protein|uniref:RRM domain-containing protein n=1 Tax=Eutreptiella gymnastica TaxID=73025 RepID=A0A7S4GH61_9EUGL|mmetsp:Transcript_80120/g.133870  ORF Transcript_80120/g.133870 Transcript_80120/m.133870 type:complete len:322 (+) Transcript_80120:55-1020(+)|eukprot:CAMPEP_0174291448 /NCGR_PEP_ID=MMETSP0809-20121228/32076_1 /TAXON_ID=73025 ORGANISM="Eutreptiella gymnastica-like, Strain CCMP1594" /NCGR_SAMPLE_ID=MMETSP0809 /ASSEMBLY_ACC=CAM_ASM_000658 /LENGTH=321 /DNA_ID=CAMNT_0015390765 /DNA_START=36 /DNA_END=1001 /DNA_ORIENTATION=+
MDDLTTSIEKLKVLLNSGIITAAEFETKRQTIVDHFVGVPTAGAAPAAKPRAKPPAPAPAPAFTPKPQAAARPPSYGLALATNHAKGKGKGGKGKGAAVAVTPAPTAQPIRPRGAFTNPRFHPYAGGRGYTKPQPWPKDWHEIATIKVQPIPMGLTDQHLVEAFAPYGDIESAVVKPGSSAHGYVNFVAPESARAAAEAESVELLGHWCWVTLGKKKHQPVEEGGPTDGLGLFNLPFATTYEELHALLAGHPGFQLVKMVYRKSGEFGGYAFAYFDSVENASAAKEALLGLMLGDQTMDVKFSKKSSAEALAEETAAAAAV